AGSRQCPQSGRRGVQIQREHWAHTRVALHRNNFHPRPRQSIPSCRRVGSGCPAPDLSNADHAAADRRRSGGKADPLGCYWEESSSTLESRSEEHTSELQSRSDLVCRLLLEKKN